MVAVNPPENRRTANRQLWPLQTVLAIDPQQLRARLTEPLVTLLVDGDAPLPQLRAALDRLANADAQVVVRIQRADEALLQTLTDGRAQGVEWVVRAPTSAAAQAWSGGTQESAGMQAAIAAAAAHGLIVRLRWRLAARAVPGLAQLDELSGLGTAVSVVVLPHLTAEDAPALDAVIAAWPRTLPADVTLLRSGVWPSCLAGFDVEPATTAERAQAAPRHVAACERCPLRETPEHPQGCQGVAAALLDRAGGPGPHWQAWQRLPTTQQHSAIAHVDPECVEARGLALGLRRAWRLFLPPADIAEYEQAFAPRGWQVRCAANVDAAAGGMIREGAEGNHVLTVVALTAQDAEDCLRDEMANLQRRPALTLIEQRAHLEAIVATHRRLGALYGYPPCCIEAFLDAHAEIIELVRQTDNAIAILRAALRTRHFDAQLTSLPGLLGEEARTPLRHLPCRFDCPASQALATTLLADLAVHNAAWTARQQTYAPEPILLFADGTCASLRGRALSATEVVDVTGLVVRPSQAATGDWAARLTALAALTDLQAVRIQPGVGLALQRGDGWHDWPVPGLNAPRAAEFPILLPFTATPA